MSETSKNIYCPQTKLREDFTPVCQSFCSHGEGVSLTDPPPRQNPPPADYPWPETPPSTEPPPPLDRDPLYGNEPGGLFF